MTDADHHRTSAKICKLILVSTFGSKILINVTGRKVIRKHKNTLSIILIILTFCFPLVKHWEMKPFEKFQGQNTSQYWNPIFISKFMKLNKSIANRAKFIAKTILFLDFFSNSFFSLLLSHKFHFPKMILNISLFPFWFVKTVWKIFCHFHLSIFHFSINCTIACSYG